MASDRDLVMGHCPHGRNLVTCQECNVSPGFSIRSAPIAGEAQTVTIVTPEKRRIAELERALRSIRDDNNEIKCELPKLREDILGLMRERDELRAKLAEAERVGDAALDNMLERHERLYDGLLAERDAAIARAEKAEAKLDRYMSESIRLAEMAGYELDRERALADRLAAACVRVTMTGKYQKCDLCKFTWDIGKKPQHAPDCPVAEHAAARKAGG